MRAGRDEDALAVPRERGARPPAAERAEAEPTLIFLHVPKAAGTTLYRVIRRQYPEDRIYPIYTSPPERAMAAYRSLPVADRARYRALAGHLLFGIHEHVPGPSRYLTVLRNPLERVISTYYFVLRTRGHPAHARIRRAGLELDEVLDRGVIPMLDNGQVRMLSGLGESVEYGGCTREHLELAKRNLKRHADLVGVAERLTETLLLARRRFGWGHVFHRRKNVTRDRPRAEALPPRTRALIREYNRLDNELYAWVRDRFDAEVRALGPAFATSVRLFQRANGVLARSRTLHAARRVVRRLTSVVVLAGMGI